ncbi:SWIM zinc finger family protein [Jatrophihabitans sp. YIM 134969]
MTDRWTAPQVLALAPDPSAAKAGAGLGRPGPWSGTGAAGTVLWGACRGSGRTPYEVVVDLAGPAFRCSCPSRKFPCKHALGLMLLWSGGDVAEAPPPAAVTTWLTERAERAGRVRSPRGDTPADPEAAARRAAQRGARVASGLDELDRWLLDQVRTGLAGTERAGYRHFDAVAARMVDAQAPAIAATLRGLPAVASGEGWPDRLLGEYGLLRLLVHAHRGIEGLPEGLAATVRSRVGFTVPREQVLATEPVRDTWRVLGSRDTEAGNLATRRTWWRGESTGVFALVLSFAAGGASLEPAPPPGGRLEADLHFHPGSPPLRALFGRTWSEPTVSAATLTGAHDLDDARRGFATVLASDPWATSWPVLLEATLVFDDGVWALVDHAGDSVPVVGAELWTLLAATGGRPATFAGEWTPGGVLLVSAWTSSGPVAA